MATELPTGEEAAAVFPRNQTKTWAGICQHYSSLRQGKHPEHLMLSGNLNVCTAPVIESPQRPTKGWVLQTCQSPGHFSACNLLFKKPLATSIGQIS